LRLGPADGTGCGGGWGRRELGAAGSVGGRGGSCIIGNQRRRHGFGLPFLFVAARPFNAFPHAGAPCCLLFESEANDWEWRRCPVGRSLVSE